MFKIKLQPAIFVLTVVLMCDFKFFTFPYFAKYILGFSWFIWSLSKRSKISYSSENRIFKLFAWPYVAMFICAPLLFLLNPINGISIVESMSRLASNFMQTISYIMFSYATFRLFREKSVRYLFLGLVINNVVGILYAVLKFGISEFVRFISNPFSEYWNTWVESGHISNALELHEVTFTLGFFLLYFLLFSKEYKSKKSDIVICIVLLVLGFKRIQVLALIGTCIVVILVRRRKHIALFNTVVNSAFIGVLSVTLLYIYIISDSYIALLAAKYNINFMSRLAWFKNLSDYYTFSVTYIGRGWTATSKIADIMNQSVHNDILRCFIDFGFCGYIAWLYYQIKFMSNKIMRINIEAAKVYLCFTVYAIITYLTDNTYNYYIFQTALLVITVNELSKNKAERY